VSSKDKSIFVGIRLDNINQWFPQHLYVVKNLPYPKDKLRIVYSLQDNVYTKSVAEKLKAFRDESKLNIEVYKEPFNKELKQYGAQMSAPIFTEWQKQIKEDYFLLLDSDIVMMPEFTIKEMMRINEPIVSPYIYMYGTQQFYATWDFRLNGRMFHHTEPPGNGLMVPIKLDSSGVMQLIKTDIFKQLSITNPYPTVGLCYDAYRRGYRTVGLPYVIVYHENLSGKYKINHQPLPAQLGRYPQSQYSATHFDRIETTSKDIMPSTPELMNYLTKAYNEYCNAVDSYSKDIYDSSEILQKEKSLKWTQNINKFYNFYFNRDPIKLMWYYYNEPIPEWFEIETSTVCNFKCKVCENTYWKEPKRFMTYEEFTKIANQFPDLKWIGTTGIGEGFLNPDYRKILRSIKERDPAIYMEFFDQFFLHDKASLKEWVDMGYDKVYISMDGSSKKVYEANRKGSNYEKVIDNIILLDRIKKDEGKHYPRFCVHYIINKDNIDEAQDILQILKDNDVDTWFVQYTKILHNFPELQAQNLHIDVPNSVVDKINKKSKETGIAARFNVNTNEMQCPSYACSAWTQPFIFATGHIIPCCACNERNERDIQKETSMGNLFENTLEEIWHGQKYKDYRKKLYSGQVATVCEPCPIFNQRAVI
jgi:MoaA/NifB/PqqE/SkfB family radical SAM enzyme